jgi:hypothetical protein
MKQNILISLMVVMILYMANSAAFCQEGFTEQPVVNVSATIPHTLVNDTLPEGKCSVGNYFRSSVIVSGLVPGIRYSFNSRIGFFAEISFAAGISDTKMYGGGILVHLWPRTFLNAGINMGKHHYTDASRTIDDFYFRPELSLQTQFRRLTLLYGMELFCRNTKDTNLGNVSDKVRLPLPVFGIGFNF